MCAYLYCRYFLQVFLAVRPLVTQQLSYKSLLLATDGKACMLGTVRVWLRCRDMGWISNSVWGQMNASSILQVCVFLVFTRLQKSQPSVSMKQSCRIKAITFCQPCSRVVLSLAVSEGAVWGKGPVWLWTSSESELCILALVGRKSDLQAVLCKMQAGYPFIFF